MPEYMIAKNDSAKTDPAHSNAKDARICINTGASETN